MPLPLASGTGRFWRRSAKIIRIVRHGCTNRPFFHISVTERKRATCQDVIEQLGTFDPMPNQFNEKLISLNLERIKYWLGKGAHVTRPTAELFGLGGFFPIHPRCYMKGWRNRQKQRNEQEAAKKESEASQSATSA